MAKEMYLAMVLQKGEVELEHYPDVKVKVEKPAGCVGICYVFKSKDDAYKWFKKVVPLITIEVNK